MLNYDLIGTLKDYTDDGPVRDDLEYDYDRIKPYHKSFDFIIKNLDELNQKFRPHDYDRRQLADTIDDLFDIISDDKPIIGKYIDHVGNHKHY
ncbi:MAG: protein kinase [Hyperionvirus sp.]|uniref:Protein kinase n=1 Tax=Hyperionvirus sp. TaxID=2487770 RepID=A0A3G5A6A5_9VIRU|nr:MAG: protein kinase [Hyperionvirus sp.]